MLHKSQEGSKEKCLAMTTGLDMLRLFMDFTHSEFKIALGRPLQRADMCRRQALFLHFLPAILIFFFNCKVNYFRRKMGCS
jgi:hypothetical protein